MNEQKAKTVRESSTTEKRKRGRPKGSKRPGSRPDVAKRFVEPEGVAPGTHSKITDYSLRVAALPKINVADKDAVIDRVYEYFELCIELDMRPGVAGLCLALGICANTWDNWGVGATRDYQDMVAKVRAIMLCDIEQLMEQGKINPVPGIFLMKNFHGMVDQKQVVVTAQNVLGDRDDVERLQQKYLDKLPPVDAEGATVEGS